MNNRITKEALLLTAPNVLKNDATMNPLVDTVADALAKLAAKCHLPSIYTRIDELPEDLLDILAVDLKVDWYNPDFSLEQKRDVIAGSFDVHRHLGTTGGMRRAMTDIWGSAVVEEWFEYGGDPFRFRVIISEIYTLEQEQRARRTIELTKNVRSALDSIIFMGGTSQADTFFATAVAGIEINEECFVM